VTTKKAPLCGGRRRKKVKRLKEFVDILAQNRAFVEWRTPRQVLAESAVVALLIGTLGGFLFSALCR
jgi:hypothetical protein